MKKKRRMMPRKRDRRGRRRRRRKRTHGRRRDPHFHVLHKPPDPLSRTRRPTRPTPTSALASTCSTTAYRAPGPTAPGRLSTRGSVLASSLGTRTTTSRLRLLTTFVLGHFLSRRVLTPNIATLLAAAARSRALKRWREGGDSRESRARLATHFC